jgi:hypothetical protein
MNAAYTAYKIYRLKTAVVIKKNEEKASSAPKKTKAFVNNLKLKFTISPSSSQLEVKRVRIEN